MDVGGHMLSIFHSAGFHPDWRPRHRPCATRRGRVQSVNPGRAIAGTLSVQRFLLQHAIRALPLSVARSGKREAPHEPVQRLALARRGLQVVQRPGVFDRVHELHAPILADADAVLRGFDPAAADALPRGDAVERGLRSRRLRGREAPGGYSYYWHGYQLLLRPALLLFSYGEIRYLNIILMGVLAADGGGEAS